MNGSERCMVHEERYTVSCAGMVSIQLKSSDAEVASTGTQVT